MRHWGWMVCETSKFKIAVYFVTSVYISTLNIVSTNKKA